MTVFWLAVVILMLIIEAVIPGLVSIWFALGALAALIVAAIRLPVWLQFAVFGVVSIVSLILTRPLAQKYVNSRAQPTNADRILGKTCIVTENIDNIAGTGQITEDGKIWTARSCDDTTVMAAGSHAIVERIEGVKAIVRPAE